MAIGADQTGQARPPGPPGTGEVTKPGTGEATRPGSGQTGGRAAGDTQWRRPGLVPSALGLRHVPGTGGPMRWFFAGIWLVYLIQPVSDLFGHHHGVLWIAGGLAITIAFGAIYVAIVCNSGSWPRQARWGLIAIAVLAALACVVYGKTWTPLWIYVSAAAGMVLAAPSYGRGTALRGVLAVGVCYAFFSWLSHDDPTNFLIVLLPVLLVGFAMIGFRMQMQLTNELAQARETVAKLAANEERLRLARDMHDLTGQSLSMITLKSELAAKRLAKMPVSAERDAGLTLGSGTFDADAEAVLAWCLREAVTNVIRHSGARTCRIRLIEHDGELSLEVTDDGRGLPGRAAGEASESSHAENAQETAQGAGLRGMSERLSAIRGRLSLGSAGHGFRLTATVPVERYDA